MFSTPNPSARRRFQDFVFLREHLSRDFPACVIPALPDKHRLGSWGRYEYSGEVITGTRRIHYWRQIQSRIYGAQTTRVGALSLFVALLNNVNRLHRFLQRLARHPTLQRSTLVRAFFESREWVR